MKISLILIMLLAVPLPVHALDKDKQLHMGISGAIALGGCGICRTLTGMSKWQCALTSGLSTIAIGALKEVGDGKRNTISEHLKDLAADTYGTSLGITACIIW